MAIKKVGVLGCGLMGSGIAQVSAVAGYDVTVLEQEQKFLDKGFTGIEKSREAGEDRHHAREGQRIPCAHQGHNQPEGPC